MLQLLLLSLFLMSSMSAAWFEVKNKCLWHKTQNDRLFSLTLRVKMWRMVHLMVCVEKRGKGWKAASSQYYHHHHHHPHHFIRLALHNGSVSIYQEANVAVIPRGSRYIFGTSVKPLTRFMGV